MSEVPLPRKPSLVQVMDAMREAEAPVPIKVFEGLALNPTPYTLRPTPYALHPTPYTLHPTPYTLHPAPETPISESQTPNPQP